MAIKPPIVNDKDRIELNKLLQEFNEIKEEAEKANRASIPGMDMIINRCDEKCQQIMRIKSEYFPGKK
ncbi:MAG: hypothetical protein QXW38_09545 [Candidatus Nitrosotenuis sp.]